MIGGAAVFRDRIWILGGGTYATPTTPQRKFYSDVWSSADGVRWQQHTQHAPWAPRQYHDVAVFDDKTGRLSFGKALSTPQHQRLRSVRIPQVR